MPLRLLVSAALVALAACSSPEEVRQRTGVTEHATSPSARATAIASSSGTGRKVAEDTDLFSYAFSYPAARWALIPRWPPGSKAMPPRPEPI
jgi:hypothetical protein